MTPGPAFTQLGSGVASVGLSNSRIFALQFGVSEISQHVFTRSSVRYRQAVSSNHCVTLRRQSAFERFELPNVAFLPCR